MRLLLFGLAVLAGLSNPIQSAANAGLNKALGIIPAVLVIYAVALLGLLLVGPLLGLSLRDLGGRLAHVPWWAWVGGVCNLCFVLAASISTQRIGSGAFTVTQASCAIVLSLLLDRLGVMGLHPHPLSALRVLGGAMAVGGIVLVSLF